MKKLLFLVSILVASIIASASDSTFYFTTSDNVRLYVRIAGRGQPCLFIHGGPGSTSYYYEAMPSASLVEQKLKMIYFDQRGSGRSDSAANRDYSLPRLIKDIEELRTSLGIAKWSLMAHSFGGIPMVNYTSAYPSAVASLMLIHCTLNIDYSMASHIDFGLNELGMKGDTVLNDKSLPVIQRVGRVHDKLTENNIWYKLMYRNQYEKDFNDSVTLSAGKFNRDFASNIWGIKDYFQDFSQQTPKIKIPVLVMTGDKDFAIGPDHYKSFAFPKQRTVHYIGGHAPFQEEPQWFAEKIIDFVNSLQ